MVEALALSWGWAARPSPRSFVMAGFGQLQWDGRPTRDGIDVPEWKYQQPLN
jgi:hypothetical protein